MGQTSIVAVTAFILIVFRPTAVGQTIAVEDFLYPQGDTLTAHGWTSGTSVTNPIRTSNPGLEFGVYQGSGAGAAVTLAPSGQDLYRTFAADSAGIFYLWAIVRVLEARSGDYFLHFHTNPPSTTLVGRVFARRAVNGLLSFGIAKRGTSSIPTAVYSDSVYAPDSTYLLVGKYVLAPGTTTDDEAALYVFTSGDLPPEEPGTAAAGPVRDASTDPATIGAIGIRQGDQSRAPTVRIDGLRVTRGWDGALPFTLDRFTALQTGADIAVAWRTLTEQGVAGFQVERAADSSGTYYPLFTQGIPAAGTIFSPQEYGLTDVAPPPGVWWYRLKAATIGGRTAESHVISVSVVTDIAGPAAWRNPADATLLQNSPNPFNGSTVITYSLPARDVVRLSVFNILGEELTILHEGMREEGRHRVQFDARRLPSGVYILRLAHSNGALTRRMTLLR